MTTSLLIFLVLLVLIAFYGVNLYNKLVKLTAMVKEAWSGIDVQLKKRYNLIPNLVEIVKGYATHERETFDSVTRARTAAQQAQTVDEQTQAESQLNKSLVNLFAVAENYPQLQSNANFLDLQRQLAAIEGDIEKARRYYNGTVRNKNILVESFPSNILANTFGYETEPYFEIDNADHAETPQIKF